MDFDDSLFGEGSEDRGSDSSVVLEDAGKDTKKSYVARVCDHEWFLQDEDGRGMDGCGSRPEEFMVLKYRADLLYYRGQFQEATRLYAKVVDISPHTHSLLRRELWDSLCRSRLHSGELTGALETARQLVSPPHDKDSSSWLLLAQCHCTLGQHEAEVLSLQRAASLQRHHPLHWTQLAHAYTHLLPPHSTPLPCRHGDSPSSYSEDTNFYPRSSLECGDDAAQSEGTRSSSELSQLVLVVAGTVNLLRPYFGISKPVTDQGKCKTSQTSLAEHKTGHTKHQISQTCQAKHRQAGQVKHQTVQSCQGEHQTSRMGACPPRCQAANQMREEGGQSGCVGDTIVRESRLCSGSEWLDAVGDNIEVKGQTEVQGGVQGGDCLRLCHSPPLCRLLTQQTSPEAFVHGLGQLSGGRGDRVLGRFCVTVSCACLLWARHLLLYSLRHSRSFAAPAQQASLDAVDRQLECYHGDIKQHLLQHFRPINVLDDPGDR